MTDADFYGTEHAREALEDERRVMETGESIVNKIEHEVMTNGRSSWSLTSKLPLRNHRGRIIGTCGISREITALKEMEEQLAAERNVLRSLVDNLPDFIFLKDPEGRYLLGNASHLRWLGLTDPTQVVGKSVFDFFPEDVARRLHEDDVAVLQSGVALINHEERLLDRAGETRWVLTTKVPWRGEGTQVLGLVCISRDVTLQKQAEENLRDAYAELAQSREELIVAMGKLQAAHQQLRQVQLQLVEAEKMKSIGRLAAGVAHEVKNPLSILKMGLDFLKTIAIPDDSAPVILHEMAEAVYRADNVIRGLLDFSAPRKLETHPADLNKIIESALKMVRAEMKAAITIDRELQPGLPLLALDAAKVSQVFINLITNALHAMPKGGMLRVRTYSRQLTGVGSNVGGNRSEAFRVVGQRIVVAEIEDDGCGIPEDKLAKVFEPFFTTKPTGAGTGLGLSVVKTIIDLHGGTIDLCNRPDRGVRATIMFQADVAGPELFTPPPLEAVAAPA
jgi:PAS domain S-box-containing protein